MKKQAATAKICRKKRQAKAPLTKVRQKIADFIYDSVRGDVIGQFNANSHYWDTPIEDELPTIVRREIQKWPENE